MKVREPEWCNPQIDDRKLPERSKNQLKYIHASKGERVKFTVT